MRVLGPHRGESRGVRINGRDTEPGSQGFCKPPGSELKSFGRGLRLSVLLLEDKAMRLKLIAWAMIGGPHC